ncbi:hypothetical protein T484DRAFT_2580317 [Baffinella frigidus]|nr:hypothetical protein T484DRAFT_2580317 [Cryptophyta sp. CCMP2293]
MPRVPCLGSNYYLGPYSRCFRKRTRVIPQVARGGKQTPCGRRQVLGPYGRAYALTRHLRDSERTSPGKRRSLRGPPPTVHRGTTFGGVRGGGWRVEGGEWRSDCRGCRVSGVGCRVSGTWGESSTWRATRP